MTKADEPIALVIEDDPDLIQIFSQALTMSGFQTTAVNEGNAALEILSTLVPNIVVLDLHLPGASGSKILGAIRADGRFAKTRVILATADYRTAEELHDSADLVLLKPISFKQLRVLSSRLLQAKD